MTGTPKTKNLPQRRRLRLGMVGGGRGGLVGEWHASGARLSNRWDLVAGALSSDPEAARKSGQEWYLDPGRTYLDYHEMAKAEAQRSDGIDAVAICTPNHTHFDIAKTFMKASINIICDKPLTNEIAEAEELETLHRESGVVFAVTYPYTFHAMVQQARELILEGAIGEIRQVMIEYAQEGSSTPPEESFTGTPWRREQGKAGRAGATGDIGTHALQVLEFVTGQNVNRLRADFHTCGNPNELEDTAFINLTLANGAPGSMWVSQAAPGNYCGLRVRVYGSTGGIEWDQEDSEYLHIRRLGKPPQIIHRGQGSGMSSEVEATLTLPRGHGEGLPTAWAKLYGSIADAVEARRDGQAMQDAAFSYPSIQTGTRGVRFIHAAADSNKAGGTWVALDE